MGSRASMAKLNTDRGQSGWKENRSRKQEKNKVGEEGGRGEREEREREREREREKRERERERE